MKIDVLSTLRWGNPGLSLSLLSGGFDFSEPLYTRIIKLVCDVACGVIRAPRPFAEKCLLQLSLCSDATGRRQNDIKGCTKRALSMWPDVRSSVLRVPTIHPSLVILDALALLAIRVKNTRMLARERNRRSVLCCMQIRDRIRSGYLEKVLCYLVVAFCVSDPSLPNLTWHVVISRARRNVCSILQPVFTCEGHLKARPRADVRYPVAGPAAFLNLLVLHIQINTLRCWQPACF